METYIESPAGTEEAAPVGRWTTRGVGPRERMEYWREVVCRNFVDIDISARHTIGFSAELRSRQLGDLRLSAVDATPHAASKRGGYGRARDDSFYGVLMVSGGGLFEQDGREAFLLPGDLTFYDATRPHQLVFNQFSSMFIIHVPRAQLNDRLAGMEHCTATRITGNKGVGAVVSSYLRGVHAQLEDPALSSRRELETCTIDLLATAIFSIRPEGVCASKSRALSLGRVREFIEQHLPDPTLDTDAISAGVGLSSRYLNKLFDDGNTSSSLMRYVWSRRLELSRRDLADAGHIGHRISDIALRWGFNDFSHFSRAFKARFGASPRQFREQALSAAVNRSSQVFVPPGARPAAV